MTYTNVIYNKSTNKFIVNMLHDNDDEDQYSGGVTVDEMAQNGAGAI